MWTSLKSFVVLLFIPAFFILSVNSISVSPSAKANDEEWARAIDKGRWLYQQLQSGCFPDVDNPITLVDLVAHGWTMDGTGGSVWPPVKDRWDGFSQFVIRTMGWTDSSDYYIKGIRHGNGRTWQQFSHYYNMYSPRNRLIAAITSNHLYNEPIHWSDATFAMWAAITTTVGSDIKDLRYIGRSSINNAFSTSIINRAFPRRSKGVKRFEAGVEAGEEAFLALLGTPNGAGSVYLLMQHKRALGFKTIVDAFVFRDGPYEWPHVIFEVADMHSAWQRADESFPSIIGGLRGVCYGVNDTIRADLVANS